MLTMHVNVIITVFMSIKCGHGNPLQYSCLKDPMDRRVWQATVHEVKKSQTQLKRCSTHSTQSDLCRDYTKLFSYIDCIQVTF